MPRHTKKNVAEGSISGNFLLNNPGLLIGLIGIGITGIVAAATYFQSSPSSSSLRHLDLSPPPDHTAYSALEKSSTKMVIFCVAHSDMVAARVVINIVSNISRQYPVVYEFRESHYIKALGSHGIDSTKTLRKNVRLLAYKGIPFTEHYKVLSMLFTPAKLLYTQLAFWEAQGKSVLTTDIPTYANTAAEALANSQVAIHERDRYFSTDLIKFSNGGKAVGIFGSMHCPGIKRHLDEAPNTPTYKFIYITSQELELPRLLESKRAGNIFTERALHVLKIPNIFDSTSSETKSLPEIKCAYTNDFTESEAVSKCVGALELVLSS